MVQSDLNEILAKYEEISETLAEQFCTEFEILIRKACENPTSFHYDEGGLRRCNFARFPYHFLYDLKEEYIRVWTVRHNRRNPNLGLRRFSK